MQAFIKGTFYWRGSGPVFKLGHIFGKPFLVATTTLTGQHKLCINCSKVPTGWFPVSKKRASAIEAAQFAAGAKRRVVRPARRPTQQCSPQWRVFLQIM
jgi:hypothetical protein